MSTIIEQIVTFAKDWNVESELWFDKGTFDDSKEFRKMIESAMASETDLHYVGYEKDPSTLHGWSMRYVQQHDESVWLTIFMNPFEDLGVQIY